MNQPTTPPISPDILKEIFGKPGAPDPKPLFPPLPTPAPKEKEPA